MWCQTTLRITGNEEIWSWRGGFPTPIGCPVPNKDPQDDAYKYMYGFITLYLVIYIYVYTHIRALAVKNGFERVWRRLFGNVWRENRKWRKVITL